MPELYEDIRENALPQNEAQLVVLIDDLLANFGARSLEKIIEDRKVSKNKKKYNLSKRDYMILETLSRDIKPVQLMHDISVNQIFVDLVKYFGSFDKMTELVDWYPNSIRHPFELLTKQAETQSLQISVVIFKNLRQWIS